MKLKWKEIIKDYQSLEVFLLPCAFIVVDFLIYKCSFIDKFDKLGIW